MLHRRGQTRAWCVPVLFASPLWGLMGVAAFTQTLESKGWTVDTQLEHPMDDPLEEFIGSPEEQEENVIRHLQELQGVKKALIIRNSHIGGHRYAGNCIVSRR